MARPDDAVRVTASGQRHTPAIEQADDCFHRGTVFAPHFRYGDIPIAANQAPELRSRALGAGAAEPTLHRQLGDSARRGAGPATGDPRAWRCASARARVRARAAAPRRLSRGSGHRCWSSGGDAAGPVPQRQ
jgi:hypothetical protein